MHIFQKQILNYVLNILAITGISVNLIIYAVLNNIYQI